MGKQFAYYAADSPAPFKSNYDDHNYLLRLRSNDAASTIRPLDGSSLPGAHVSSMTMNVGWNQTSTFRVADDDASPDAFISAMSDEMLADDQPGEMDDQTSTMMDTRLSAMLSLATLYIIITVIGFTSNAAVLYMIARSRRSKAVTSVYIFNLAIADLLYVVCLPAAVYPMLNGHWVLGHIVCKLYYTCDGVSKFASVMFLVVLSFDRYMAVCHPIASRAVRTAKVAFIASGASWLLVILAMIPVFVYATLVRVNASGQHTLQCVIYWPAAAGQSDVAVNETDEASAGNTTYDILAGVQNLTVENHYRQEMNDTGAYTLMVTSSGGTDWARRIFTLYIFSLSFAAPLLLVWIFYIMIIHRLWTQKRNLFNAAGASGGSGTRKSERAMLPANKANQRRRKSTKRVTVMVLSIVIAYTLCWVPYWCVQLTIEFFREDPALDFEIFTIISYIAYGAQSINSALNPFLYAFGTQTHRRRLLGWLRRFIHFVGCDRRIPCFANRDLPAAGKAQNKQIPRNATMKNYRNDCRSIEFALTPSIGSQPRYIPASAKRQLLSVHRGCEAESEKASVYSKSPASSMYNFKAKPKELASTSSTSSGLTSRNSMKMEETKFETQVNCCFQCSDTERDSFEKRSNSKGP